MEQRDPASQASPRREAPFTFLRCPTVRSSIEGWGVKMKEQKVVTGEDGGTGKAEAGSPEWENR